MATLRDVSIGRQRVSGSQRALDYLALGKPRLVIMILAVTAVGFYMGSFTTPDGLRLFHLLVGTTLAASGTLALNQYIERREDALMLRTQSRPLPAGRVEPLHALWIGLASTAVGSLYITLMLNMLAGLVTVTTTCSYLFAYTPLKRKTPLCSLVGAIPGALPPVTGWVAARGVFDSEAWVMFAILFLWQQPHSLAIAWLYREEYARAGFRVLPAVDPGGRSTGRQIIISCAALVAIGLLPTLMGFAGLVCFIAMLILGLGFLGFGLDMAFARTNEAARRLVFASLVYLPLAFLLMAIDKVPAS